MHLASHLRRSITRRRAARALAAGAVAATAAFGVTGVATSEPAEFVAGSGRVFGQFVHVGPSAGQLSLAPSYGLGLADYLSTTARAESRVLDFAALDDSVPKELKDRAPALRVTSTDDGADRGKTATLAGDGANGAPKQSVRATRDPIGEAGFDAASFSLGGLVEAEGGSVRVRTGVVKAGLRESLVTVRIGRLSLGGGAVELQGLVWRAVQRTGAEQTNDASFEVGRLVVNGQQVPVPGGGTELAQVLGPVNQALAPTGLVLDPPVAANQAGVARITPLAVRIADSALGRQLLAPLVGAAQPVREPLFAPLAGSEASAAVLLADVSAGVLTGAGRLDLEFGGGTAYTEGEVFDDPFAVGDDFGAPLPAGDLGAAGGSAPFGAAGGSVDTDALPDPAAGGPAAVGGGTQTLTPAAALRTIPGTRGGRAALVGLAGVLAAATVAALDLRRARTGRRRIPLP